MTGYSGSDDPRVEALAASIAALPGDEPSRLGSLIGGLGHVAGAYVNTAEELPIDALIAALMLAHREAFLSTTDDEYRAIVDDVLTAAIHTFAVRASDEVAVEGALLRMDLES